MVRFDLDINYSLSTVDDFEASGISIYPNPTKNTINIDGFENGTITLYNTIIVLLSTYNASQLNDNKIDINNLPKGMYLLSFKNNDKVYCTKIVKE